MSHSTVYLSLGSNLGDRKKNLAQALAKLAKRAGNIRKKSPLYETEPVGKKNQPWFLNQCVEIATELPPVQFLKICQQIEKSLGRVYRERCGPREIDIDALFYGNRAHSSSSLTLPHPRLHQRRFVLIPLAHIAPSFRHPILKKTVKELLKDCKDTSIVKLGLRSHRQSQMLARPRARAVRSQQ
jgi:2-amino-4-hydroxy-6-hydroxymethyldihydropteridine diphosphokinase